MAELDPEKQIALEEYKEVVAQFRELTEIRFKLLAYLPLGTVAAALLKDDLMKQPAIPAFAFVVTLCIAIYNKRNDQFYDELVARAAELERQLQIEHGSFMHRPKYWLKYSFVEVDHRWAIGWLYTAAASFWAYMFVDALDRGQYWFQLWQMWSQPWLLWLQSNSIWLKLAVPVLAWGCLCKLHRIEKNHKYKLKRAVRELMDDLLSNNGGLSRDQLVKKIAGKKKIFGIGCFAAGRRVDYYWEAYHLKWSPPRAPHAASALLSGVLDLPPDG